MKKLSILAILILLAVSSLSAETKRFDDARRYFEIGADANAGGSNNYFNMSDIFQEVLVLDFNLMADELSDNGLSVGVDAGASAYANLNLKNFGLGLYTGTSAIAHSSIPKSIFELLSGGNEIGKEYSGDMNIRGDAFVSSGVWFGTNVPTPIGPFTLKVSPAYYVPIFHIHEPTTSYTLVTNADGSTTAKGQVDIPVYTAIPGQKLEDDTMTSDDVSEALSSGGLDISASAEYQLLPFLGLGARIQNLPLSAAELSYRTRIVSTFEMNADPVLEDLDAVESGDFITTSEENEFYHDQDSVKVYRPFKIGFTADFRPLNSRILSLHPNLDFAVHDGAYADVGLKAQSNLLNIFIFEASTNYEDRVWKQRAGLTLNLRVLEVQVLAGGQSEHFGKSFTGAGFNMMVGMRMGF